MSDSINGDLAARVVVDTTQMEWTESPSGAVWRKRVHLVGSPESGQVTSVVRYEPGSRFPPYDHPQGEEILVIDGVFSDEHGDWPAGTYLLNPEGFRHAPFSEPGCRLFVKLRQFPGREREHVVMNTLELPWQPGSRPGVAEKLLYQQAGFRDSMRLERWEPGADLGTIEYPFGVELLIMSGNFVDDVGAYDEGCWMRLPAGFAHHPRSVDGCTMYIKSGGLRYLRSAPPRPV